MTDLGGAWTHARDRRSYLADLSVPVDRAPEALAAIVAELAAQRLELLVLDVPAGDEVAAAAVASTEAALQGTQMQLDLAAPVEAPPRVSLQPMSDGEFATYRDQLVSSYAQDLFDSGAFLDLESATSRRQPRPRSCCPTVSDSPGHHLWTGYDGGTDLSASSGSTPTAWPRSSTTSRCVPSSADAATGARSSTRAHAPRSTRRRGAGPQRVRAQRRSPRPLRSAGYATTEQTFRIALS